MISDLIGRWFLEDTGTSAANHVIVTCVGGSMLHGTMAPDDNVNLMGVYLPPINDLLGMGNYADSWHRDQEGYDVAFYTVRKWFRALINATPDAMDMLWVPDLHLLSASAAYDLVRYHRDIFVSASMIHRTYLKCARDHLYDMMEQGFDTTDAMNSIRVLRMGCEFIETGELIPDRTSVDSEELKEIKAGGWTLEQVIAEFGKLETRMSRSKAKSKLRAEPDVKRALMILVTIHKTLVCR